MKGSYYENVKYKISSLILILFSTSFLVCLLQTAH